MLEGASPLAGLGLSSDSGRLTAEPLRQIVANAGYEGATGWCST